jgi:hypothetical protein
MKGSRKLFNVTLLLVGVGILACGENLAPKNLENVVG